jgi:hypothetical protein
MLVLGCAVVGRARAVDADAAPDSVGNLGWIGGGAALETRSPSGSLQLKTEVFLEPGFGSRSFDEYGSKLDLHLSQVAFGVEATAATPASKDVAVDYGIGAQLAASRWTGTWTWTSQYGGYHESDLDAVYAATVLAGPVVGVCVRAGDALEVRPFGLLGMAAHYLTGGHAYGFVGDGFQYGLAWKIGIEFVPKGIPFVVGVGQTHWSYRQDRMHEWGSSAEDANSDKVTFISLRFRQGT